MRFKRDKRRYISISEMNDHLKYVFKYYQVVIGKRGEQPLLRTAYIEDTLVYFKLTYKKGSEPCTYITRKDGTEEMSQAIDGGEAYRIMCKYYKVPHVDPKICGRSDEGGMSASPILYFNPKYEGMWLEAYGYDLNSAYAYAMLQPIPDTSVPPRSGYINPGEIGFEEVLNPKKGNETTMLVSKESGFSLYIFPLMESPFKRFVEKWYQRKLESEPGSVDRVRAKGVLNYSVGYLQKVNPFIRATIITRCNNIIESLMDDNTLFCNTDSIVSLVPLDVNIGDKIGEWKLEHRCKVAYKGYNYQWSDGDVSYRSIPKSWMPKGWDITKDPPPKQGNSYKFDGRRLVRSGRS